MSDLLSRASGFVLQLLGGGTMEIVLLIVLAIIALVLLVLAVWLLWKLLGLLGKGILWAASRGSGAWRERSKTRAEARATAPPGVSTGWSATGRLSLRKALMEARRLTDGDALRIVVVDGDGGGNLCRSLGLSPPGAGAIRLAAGGDVVLIDASSATRRDFRRLAGALPWRRPLDAIAVLVDAEGIPREAISRAAALARAIGMRVAVHFVLPSASKAAAWRIIDANSGDAGQVTADLGGDTVRQWLGGGSREGLDRLALAQSGGLPAALDRARSVAPSAVLDVASLSFGGAGLRGAAAQTAERTRPAAAPGLWTWASLGVFVVGAALAALAATVSVDRAMQLRAAVQAAGREAAVPWSVEGVPTVPSAGRMRHIADVARRLSDVSGFSPLTPAAPLVPNSGAPRELASSFLESYLLRPLAAALEVDAARRLEPRDEPQGWINDARVVGQWVTAWEGLSDDPREVDLRTLLADAFGGTPMSWPDGLDEALHDVGTIPPRPGAGGLDVDGITEYARASFMGTMQRWADSVYTNGPVATAARRASDRSATWRDQHAALLELRTALQDPSQQWLTAAEDRPDHAFELRVLGQTVGLVLVGQVAVIEAKAAISRIRIEARDAAEYFILPSIGPLMARAGEGGGPSLVMSAGASAWLGFLDRVANAGFGEVPAASVTPPIGPVLLDVGAVAETRRRLQVFDQFSSNLPAELPPAVAQDLVRQLAAELTIGAAADVENALRLENDLGTPVTRAERRVAHGAVARPSGRDRGMAAPAPGQRRSRSGDGCAGAGCRHGAGGSRKRPRRRGSGRRAIRSDGGRRCAGAAFRSRAFARAHDPRAVRGAVHRGGARGRLLGRGGLAPHGGGHRGACPGQRGFGTQHHRGNDARLRRRSGGRMRGAAGGRVRGAQRLSVALGDAADGHHESRLRRTARWCGKGRVRPNCQLFRGARGVAVALRERSPRAGTRCEHAERLPGGTGAVRRTGDGRGRAAGERVRREPPVLDPGRQRRRHGAVPPRLAHAPRRTSGWRRTSPRSWWSAPTPTPRGCAPGTTARRSRCGCGWPTTRPGGSCAARWKSRTGSSSTTATVACCASSTAWAEVAR